MVNKILNLYRKNQFCDDELVAYRNLTEQIEEVKLEDVKNSLLIDKSQQLKLKSRKGIPLDELLVDAYALLIEVIKRVLGLKPFSTQIMAGIALSTGKLVEMQTGEGKTLAAVFPAYLNALTGNGVHILTANDYLAKRDAAWMSPVFTFLGLSVGFVNEGMSKAERKKAYAADITYITAKEAGFDYLRDSLCYEVGDLVHRNNFNFAIVDEADSIMIDEARIPLVIAENITSVQKVPSRVSKVVDELDFGLDFNTDEFSRNAHLTEEGTSKVEEMLGCGNIYAPENYELLLELNCSIHARALLKHNVDYIVQNGKVELVDGFTGRIADKRMWPDGLQSAIEAKEGLSKISQGRILSSITMQAFLKNYSNISGMTATAHTSSDEFKELYDLDVVIIPQNKPCIRVDYDDLIFTHKEAKFKALISEIKRVHKTKQPILIGTASIEESEELSKALYEAGIKCNVLNAKNDEQEAGIIAQAGRLSAVTVSTNMAGRGTDILLGGLNGEDRDKVVALGGLYVIGTNKNESKRVDNQLRGRSGRQGDPGCSRFFISFEDDLFSKYSNLKLKSIKKVLKKQNDPVDNRIYFRAVEEIQRVAEGQNEDIRRLIYQYFYIVEDQRKIIYKKRKDILFERTDFSLLCTMAEKEYNDALKNVSRKSLMRVERYTSLFQIDNLWADYINLINYLREGIHLVNIGGRNPFEEYCRLLIKEFQELTHKIDVEIVNTFKSLDFSKGDIDLDKAGIKSPASTWTYRITDNPFADDLGVLLANDRNIGYAVLGPLLIWPIILFGIIYNRIKKGKLIK